MGDQGRLQKDATGSGSHEVRMALEGFDLGLVTGVQEDETKKKRSKDPGPVPVPSGLSGGVGSDIGIGIGIGIESADAGANTDLVARRDAYVVAKADSSPEPVVRESLAKKKREGSDTLGNLGDVVEEKGEHQGLDGTRTKSESLSLSPGRGQGQEVDVGLPPSQFICPITMEVMVDPVILSSGHTYDRESIREWLKGRKTDPLTGARLRHCEMTPNHALKSAIVEWMEGQGGGGSRTWGSCRLEGAGTAMRAVEIRDDDEDEDEDEVADEDEDEVADEGEVEDRGGDGQPQPQHQHQQQQGREERRRASEMRSARRTTNTTQARVGAGAGATTATMEQAHDEIIWAIKHYGGRVYTASADGTCRVWDAETRRCVHVFDDHRRPVLCIAVVKGRYLATGGYDHRIHVYEMHETGGGGVVDWSYRHVGVLEGHEDAVRSLVVVGEYLVSGSYDGTCRCWAFEEGGVEGTGERDRVDGTNRARKIKITCVSVMQGHTGPVRALTAVGSRLFSGSYDSTVKCWEVSTGACLGTLKGHGKPVRALVRVDTVESIESIECVESIESIESADTTTDTTNIDTRTDVYIASGSDDTTVRIWDARSLQCVAVLRGHSDNVRSLASVPGRYVLSASWDKTIRVWDCVGWQEVAVLRGHSEAVLALAVCPEAGLAVSGSFDCMIRSWSLADFRCVQVFDVHGDAVRVVDVEVVEVVEVVEGEDGGEGGGTRRHVRCYSGGYDGSVGVVECRCEGGGVAVQRDAINGGLASLLRDCP